MKTRSTKSIVKEVVKKTYLNAKEVDKVISSLTNLILDDAELFVNRDKMFRGGMQTVVSMGDYTKYGLLYKMDAEGFSTATIITTKNNYPRATRRCDGIVIINQVINDVKLRDSVVADGTSIATIFDEIAKNVFANQKSEVMVQDVRNGFNEKGFIIHTDGTFDYMTNM